MTYYKITFESNTLEGLNAIQGKLQGQGTSVADTISTDIVAPPPSMQDEQSQDAFSGGVPAPPAAGGMDSNLESDVFFQPPPSVGDATAMNAGTDEEIAPPPTNGLASQEEDHEAPSGKGFAPPPQTAAKGPKPASKGSK